MNGMELDIILMSVAVYKVSLSKILNPKLLLMSSWRLAWQPPSSVYECVCEWVNVAL